MILRSARKRKEQLRAHIRESKFSGVFVAKVKERGYKVARAITRVLFLICYYYKK